MLMRFVLLGFCSLLGCDADFMGNDKTYPGAPVISLKALKNDSKTFRYMVVADAPLPYDVRGSVAIRQQGVYLFDEIMIDPRDNNGDLSLKEAQDIYGEEFVDEVMGVVSRDSFFQLMGKLICLPLAGFRCQQDANQL